MSRAAFALVFVAGMFAGGAAATLDRSCVPAVQAPAAAQAAPSQAAPAASAPRARIAPCVAAAPECPRCAPAPSMPGAAPGEEPRDEIEAAARLASCTRDRIALQGQLAVARGTVEPAMTEEEENAALLRHFDVPILVRRPDGSVRVYGPDEWPPAGGIGRGSRILAKVIRQDGGPDRLGPLDAGPDWRAPPSPWLMLGDGGAE